MKLFEGRRGISLVGMLALLGGCTLAEVKEQTQVVESLASVTGEVQVTSDARGDIWVQALRPTDFAHEILRNHPADANGGFQLNLLPGEYAFAAFIDTNSNGRMDEGEHGTYPGMERRQPRLFRIASNLDAVIPPIVISGPVQLPRNFTVKEVLDPRMQNTGTVHSLDAPMFSTESATMGLWRPVDYITELGGGIVFLETYDPDKIPVLFVHGIGGTAKEFGAIIEGLDSDKFQPWVYQYASGVSLAPTADFMVHALSRLQSLHGFDKIVIVAHSMGGLMSRDYIHKHTASQPDYSVALAVTINSPLHGMDSAAVGVETSPITIPSWRDVASNSKFVRDAHAAPWPEDIPYHLVFSFLPGDEGDGTVPMKSQLTRELQREATQIHGFQAGHAAILKDDEFIELIQEILAAVH